MITKLKNLCKSKPMPEYKIPYPDYARNAIVIDEPAKSWEVTTNGFVQLQLYLEEGPANALASLKINGATVVYDTCSTSSTSKRAVRYMSPIFPVKKGDIVSVPEDGVWDLVACVYYAER